MKAQASIRPRTLVSGAFDDLRSGDLRFLEEAAKLGDLTVLLSSDEQVRRQTGQPPKFPEKERVYLLRGIRYVSQVEIDSENARKDAAVTPGNPPPIWVVRESEAKAVGDLPGGTCRVIRNADLQGFPGNTTELVAADPKKKKVIVTGCFDWLHSGHVRFFEEANSYGDLYVIVGHDANIRLLKGEGHPMFPAAERRYVVGSVCFVKQSLVSTGEGWLDAEPEIQRLKPDIYTVNEDGDRPVKREYCGQHGIQYVVLKRTPAPGLPKRSSTELRGH